MKSNKVFIDTSGFVAVSCPKDQYHQKATKLWEKLIKSSSELFTSNFVLDETYTLLRGRIGVNTVIKFRNMLVADPNFCQVISVSTIDEVSSWQWFVRDSKKLSYTDATSFAVMKRLEIPVVFGFDEHFTQVGLRLFE